MKMRGVVALGLALLMGMPAVAIGMSDRREARHDKQIDADVTEQLRKRDKFQAVTASTEDGIVTLNGDVELYVDKVDAEKRARKVKNVDGVRNRISIASSVHDDALREQLGDKLRYDRIGYGIVFNNLTMQVDSGVVTIGGKVRNYPDRDSAIAIVQTTPGVKDVIDEIDVAPTSMVDDRLRIRLARAIYGHSALQKYAIDPQAPIRIVVENGNVELHGVVLNTSDKQIAYMQASAVPGVFSVKNGLLVAAAIKE